VAGFVLRGEEEEGGASGVGAKARLDPGKTVKAMFDGSAHEMMPGRVKDDFIAAVAEAIMSFKDRLVFVGIEAPALRLFCAEECADFL
jgi:hypothetical protein